MASRGICDRVAIVGAACTPFGDLWAKGTSDLLVEAHDGALASAGAGRGDVDAYWLATLASGYSGMLLAEALRLDDKPVSRVENLGASGTEALRNACYAVAAGASDVAVAIGVDKLGDAGHGLEVPDGIPVDGSAPVLTSAARFGPMAAAYALRYGVAPADLEAALSGIGVKNRANGLLNPLAVLDGEDPGAGARFADGAAAVVVVRAEDAHRWTDRPLYVKGLAVVTGRGRESQLQAYDFASLPEVRQSADQAYRQAGVVHPRDQLALAEVHDELSVTELIVLEALQLAAPGVGWRECLSGAFDLDGDVAVNPDGGLTSLGNPVGASGLRMLYECWVQLRQEAPGDRQVAAVTAGRTLAATQSMGGSPGTCVSATVVVGTELNA